jgi:hypothetical protein
MVNRTANVSIAVSIAFTVGLGLLVVTVLPTILFVVLMTDI